MYRIGRGIQKSRRRYIRKVLFIGVLAALLGGAWWLHEFMSGTDDTTTTPQAITREYAPTQVDTNKAFDAPEFHMELPNDWVFKEHQTNPYNMYTYQASAKNEDNRWVEIYVDNVPTTKTFNRLRPVTITDGVITMPEQISDNCYDMAGQKPVVQQKYAGVSFQCDIANYSRNVVGVGAVGRGTAVKLGKHRFMIVYTDHNMRPNYQILDDMLKSFRVKD